MYNTVGFARPLAFLLAAGLLFFLAPLAAAHGGGTPQLVNEPTGPYWLSVWTSPDPPQAGKPLHFTVGLAEPGSGREAGAPVLGVEVIVTMSPAQGMAPPVQAAATNANAANRLFYEADLTLTETGVWSVEIGVAGREGSGSASFQLEVVEANGTNWLLWGGGGALVIAALYFVVGRRGT
jgi:hypothetical protein